MKVKEFMKIVDDEFHIVVQEPNECFDYECHCDNKMQYDDFCNREIWRVDFTLKKVCCW